MNKIYAEELIFKTRITNKPEEFLTENLTEKQILELAIKKEITFNKGFYLDLAIIDGEIYLKHKKVYEKSKVEKSDLEIAQYITKLDKEIREKLNCSIYYTSLEHYAIVYENHERYDDIKFFNETIQNDEGRFYILKKDEKNSFSDKVIKVPKNKNIQSHYHEELKCYSVSNCSGKKLEELVRLQLK